MTLEFGIEIQLDNIDIDLVKLILDVLEHFDMFWLCLIVCNRYGLYENIGRYLSTVCYRYSNLKYIQNWFTDKINNQIFWDTQRNASILANEAIHSMLGLIDPKVLTQKVTILGEKFDANIWWYIFYFGFWNKLIYITDSLTSLWICLTIGSLDHFKRVYLLNYWPELSNSQI